MSLQTSDVIAGIASAIAGAAFGVSIWSLILARRADKRQRSMDRPTVSIAVAEARGAPGWALVTMKIVNRTDSIWEIATLEARPQRNCKMLHALIRQDDPEGKPWLFKPIDVAASVAKAVHMPLRFQTQVNPSGTPKRNFEAGDQAHISAFVWVSGSPHSVSLIVSMISQEPGAKPFKVRMKRKMANWPARHTS